ncbi:MAG: hypothetical protein KAJ49_08575, partial [Arcobacteraceae bacterium]|nr:hypothetical protein [Arcobacteraceae bacterium]
MIIRTINYDKDILDAAGGGPHFESFYTSNDTTFIEEALKYECPIRFLIYFENNKGKFTLVDKADTVDYQ